jgi:hypothetical protein
VTAAVTATRDSRTVEDQAAGLGTPAIRSGVTLFSRHVEPDRRHSVRLSRWSDPP